MIRHQYTFECDAPGCEQLDYMQPWRRVYTTDEVERPALPDGWRDVTADGHEYILCPLHTVEVFVDGERLD